jgi:signal transduction histidine kinase
VTQNTEKDRPRSPANQHAERVKELNCLYDVSRLFYRQDLDLPTVLRELVEIVPGAWQHPEICRSCITLNGTATCTEGYVATPWMQTERIHVQGKRAGTLSVCYLEPRPDCDEGPFLKEERSLLRTIARDVEEIAERRRAEGQILLYQEQLRSLARATARAEQEERRAIAQELHDRVGQTLATLRIKVDLLAQAAGGAAVKDELDGIRDLVNRSIADTRTLLFEISPPILDEFGLQAALEWLAEQSELPVELVVESPPDPLSGELRSTLFRAVRELLANVTKHARASRVQIRITRIADTVRVSVEDDGVGFDVDDALERMLKDQSFGLFSIRERVHHLGGQFRVTSGPGRGTRVVLTVHGGATP